MGNNNNFCTFYIVRHGETEWNIIGKVQGQKDSSLTSNGIVQAQKAAGRFKKTSFDKVFSSDLLRAKRTAEIIALEHKLAVKTNELLRERSFGRFEGRAFKRILSELRGQFEKRELLAGKKRASFRLHKEIENDEELVARFITFLRETAVAYSNKKILVVTHGGVMRTFLIHLGFAGHRELQARSISNTGYIIVESDGIEFNLKKVSISHGS